MFCKLIYTNEKLMIEITINLTLENVCMSPLIRVGFNSNVLITYPIYDENTKYANIPLICSVLLYRDHRFMLRFMMIN